MMNKKDQTASALGWIVIRALLKGLFVVIAMAALLYAIYRWWRPS